MREWQAVEQAKKILNQNEKAHQINPVSPLPENQAVVLRPDHEEEQGYREVQQDVAGVQPEAETENRINHEEP